MLHIMACQAGSYCVILHLTLYFVSKDSVTCVMRSFSRVMCVIRGMLKVVWFMCYTAIC